MDHHPDVLAFLNRDPLKHIVPLKMLAAYPQHIRSYYYTQGSAAGVLLLLPAQVSAYDARAYPDTDYVVSISADSAGLTAQMLDLIPATANLVFKLTAQGDRVVIERRFPLKRIAAFLSYTCPPDAQFRGSTQVIISEQLDPRLLPLYAQNDYSPETVASYFEVGQAVSFSVYANDAPLSTCLAFQNYQRIWEIGALYTVEHARRHGFGRQIVETALAALLARGYTPRYQMAETNLASRRLAERVGLQRFLTTTHYLHQP